MLPSEHVGGTEHQLVQGTGGDDGTTTPTARSGGFEQTLLGRLVFPAWHATLDLCCLAGRDSSVSKSTWMVANVVLLLQVSGCPNLVRVSHDECSRSPRRCLCLLLSTSHAAAFLSSASLV
jgi:hypothetical protein